MVLQIIFGVNRVRNLDWEIKYGSEWVSITDDLVAVILENQAKITKVFSCTNCADELFIQTIAYNCGFKEKIYQPELNQAANLRLIDWSRGKNGNPYTFEIQAEKLLVESSNLFARKFSISIDAKIVLRILERRK